MGWDKKVGRYEAHSKLARELFPFKRSSSLSFRAFPTCNVAEFVHTLALYTRYPFSLLPFLLFLFLLFFFAALNAARISVRFYASFQKTFLDRLRRSWTMEPPDDNEPVVKVASAASKQTQRERSFLGTRILFHGHATCHESWKEGTYRLPTSVPLERIRRNKKYKNILRTCCRGNTFGKLAASAIGFERANFAETVVKIELIRSSREYRYKWRSKREFITRARRSID